MSADGRYGVGMRWVVLTPSPLQLRWSACAEPVEAGRPEPCAGAFQCGIRHVSPDVLSALKPAEGGNRAPPHREGGGETGFPHVPTAGGSDWRPYRQGPGETRFPRMFTSAKHERAPGEQVSPGAWYGRPAGGDCQGGVPAARVWEDAEGALALPVGVGKSGFPLRLTPRMPQE